MKFMHISDLHIGKRLNGYSMLEDQEYILGKITNITDEEKPDALLIAGDIYDKAVPSAEAVRLFDSFLYELSKRNIKVFVISGNHDSSERIAFGSRIMNSGGIYMSPVYDGKIYPLKLKDEFGEINIWMIPFVKPANVRVFFADEEINTYTDALKTVIDSLCIDKSQRNILVTHQFVTGADRTESEEISVGGADNVDVSVFEDFDYVALGHIHRAQKCTWDKVRYCGTPLKYSFSEAKDIKSVTSVEINKKDSLNIKTIPLTPKRDMVEIKGKYDDIILRDFYKDTTYTEDYIHITLTDEEDIPDAIMKLRTVYHNLMKLSYDNMRTRNTNIIEADTEIEKKSPIDLFESFYMLQNNQSMSDEQKQFTQKLITDIWEGEK